MCFALSARVGDPFGVNTLALDLAGELSLSAAASSACVVGVTGDVSSGFTPSTLTSPAMATSYSSVSSAIASWGAGWPFNKTAAALLAASNLLAVSNGRPKVLVFVEDSTAALSAYGWGAMLAGTDESPGEYFFPAIEYISPIVNSGPAAVTI